MKKTLILTTAVLSSLLISSAASADPHYRDYRGGHGWGHHNPHSRGGLIVSFNTYARPYPAYPAYYPVYRTVYSQPVVVQQPVYVQAPQVVEASNQGYCREYQSQTTVGGQRAQSYGTACMQPDGSWKIMN